MMEKNIKRTLDELCVKYNSIEFFNNDPVRVVREYSEGKSQQEAEAIAFLVSMVSWGNRKMVVKSAACVACLFESYKFDDKTVWNQWCKADVTIHRTFKLTDYLYMLKGLSALYEKYETMESLFGESLNVWQGMDKLRNIFRDANGGKYNRHFPDPSKSACKRLNMMLRWLVRKDGIVDIGLWKSISPSELFIPLDVHVGNTAREFGFLDRKSNDRKAVEQLSRKLRQLDSEDPCKYDFALFGYGYEKTNMRK